MTTVQLATRNRWDALELMDALLHYHPYLVQRSRSQWVVHVAAEADAAAVTEDLRSVVETLTRRRPLGRAEVTFGDGTSLILN
jgi:hypothetical protein